MSRKIKELYRYQYQYHYPTYLTPAKLVWVVKEGDILVVEAKKYRVVRVSRSAVPGQQPVIEIKDVNESIY